jgi:ABC-2 type transport system permease protein
VDDVSFFRLAWAHLKIGVMNELQYRVNFFIQLFQSLLALATGLIGLWLVFSQTNELGGWGQSELLAVMGVHIAMGGVIQTFIQPNMGRLMDDVRKGTLDYTLTKPADSQALVSIREVRIWSVVDVLTGAIVLGVAGSQLERRVGVGDAAAFVLALVLGAVMIYCFWLILTTGAFKVVRVENILELFSGVYQAGRWPVGIYPLWMRGTLTFLIPVAFAVTVPAESLTSRLTTGTLVLAIVFTAALIVVTRIIWRLGLRSYTGASA